MERAMIISFKNLENPVDLPTKVGDLDVLHEENGMTVYGLKSCKYQEALGSLFVSKIKALIPEKHLLNTIIVIWAGKTGIYLSYDDDGMALPFEKPFNYEANEQVVQNMLDALECNEILGK